MTADFFAKNLDIIFLVYGLAFIVMAIAILIQPRRESQFKLSKIIWILAAFGLTHGLNEWLDMLNIIKGYHSFLWHFSEAALLAVSYIFFFEFGRRLIWLSSKKLSLSNYFAFIYYCLVFLMSLIFSSKEPNILPRYFLGLPAGILSGLGFILYYLDNKAILRLLAVGKYFLIAAIAITLYGILGGAIVPHAGFFPASVINNDSFWRVTGVPVQAFRAVCAIILSWSVWKILGIFNWEIRQKLEENVLEITAQKDYVNGIVESIADSLLVIGQDGKIFSINKATQELLRFTKEELIGKPVSYIFEQRRFEEILNEFDEAAFLLSKDFTIIEANNAFLQLMSLPKDKITGQHCYKLTHDINNICQPPADRCPVLEVQACGAPCVELHKHFDKDGREFLVNVTAAPIKDSLGEIVYYLHITKNIRKEEEKAESLQKDALVVKLLISKLESYCNTLHLRKIFVDSDLTHLNSLNSFKNLEMYYKAKNGEKIPVNVSGSARRDKNGLLLSVVCIVKDMREIKNLTEREKEVAAIKAATEAERKRLEEIERLQSHLIQAEKMHMVGRLASGIAHEVKNPLAIIMQGIEFFKEKTPDADENITMTLKYIEDAVLRADKVIRGLLDFSSLSQLEMKPQDINLIIESSLLLMKHNIERPHILLNKDLKSGLPAVKIDKNRIEQVLINLILNAIQAMPEGGTLDIRTFIQGEEPADKWLVVQIDDTGKGIPDAFKEKIFDPFFTTKRDIGGTGLGLSIVKNIIETHNGRIEVENKKDGQGARASIKFKL